MKAAHFRHRPEFYLDDTITELRCFRRASSFLLVALAFGAGCADLMGFEEGHPFPPDSGQAAGGSDAATSPDVSTADGPVEAAALPNDGGPCSTPNPTPTTCLANTPQFCNVSGSWESVASGPCRGASTCSTGMCVCNFTTCPGGCADLTTDGHNCGTCGHDCQGGACQVRKCQPVVLASKQNHPNAIAADGTSVYWLNSGDSIDGTSSNGAVMKISLGSAASPTPLALGQVSPGSIAVDATSVYWTVLANAANVMNTGEIRKIPVDGGAITQLVTGQNSVWSMTIDPTYARVSPSRDGLTAAARWGEQQGEC